MSSSSSSSSSSGSSDLPSATSSSTSRKRGLENAQAVIDNEITPETAATYDGVVKFIEKEIRNIQPAALDANGKLKIPMNFIHFQEFFGTMAEEREDKTVRAVSTLGTYANAIKSLHIRAGSRLSQEHYEYCKRFSGGFKRVVARKKDEGVMKQKEGKVPVTLAIYIGLCKIALFICGVRSAFSCFIHLFLILCWNLFSRSVSVSGLRTTHLHWSNDAMVVDYALHKSDQAGDHITPKHVFANVFEPCMCPILALAMHIFCRTYRPGEQDSNKIFSGTPYDIFSKWLPTAFADLNIFTGLDSEDFGTHSFRKGVTSFCAGFLGGPSVIAIFLRAGWSLGQVQDRYIQFCEGGDQLAGRIAAGLNFNSGANFAVLPPHFADNALTPEEWLELLPYYNEYPSNFQVVLQYLLASLVYHWDWISETDENGKRYCVCAVSCQVSKLTCACVHHVHVLQVST